MAKKKLNQRFAAAVVITAVVLGGGGYLSFKTLYQTVRPAQLKAAGAAALKKGDYKAAFDSLSRVGQRLSGDVDFLRMLYESQMRLTSFNEGNYSHARSLLDNISTLQPDDAKTYAEKLRVDLGYVDRVGVDQANGPFGKRIGDTADRLLKLSPDEPLAHRGAAVARVGPLFDAAAVPSSADVQATLDSIAASLKALPDDPTLTLLYAQASTKLRDALVRERAVTDGTADPRVRAIADDVEARIVSLAKFADDASKPASARAVAALRAMQSDQALAILRGTDDKAAADRVNARFAASLARAVELAKPDDVDTYRAARGAQATILTAQGKVDEAEAIDRGTVDGLPAQWGPRLALASFLVDHGKAADAVATLNADLKPSTDLVGLDGLAFIREALAVPLQRAFTRLQSLGALPADQRAAAIAAADEDYKTATARIPESDPRAMQVRAGLQEVRQDRTGAIQTLTLALNANPDEALRRKMMEQLVSLNLASNQTGAAAQILDQLYERTQNNLSLLRLIELNQRNGRTDVARSLLAEAKKRLPNNAAVAALELRMTTDPKEQQALLDRVPETSAASSLVKVRLAASTGDIALTRAIAERAVKAFPEDVELRVGYADLLTRANDRPAAVAQLTVAQKLKPDDKTIAYLLANAQATSATQRTEVANDYVEQNVTDPYRRALVDAERARNAGDEAGYFAKLQEADGLDANKEGIAAERLFVNAISKGKFDDAERYLKTIDASRRDPSLARTSRVRLLLARGDVEAAQAEADKIINDLPGYSGGWLVEGLVRAARGQFDEAVKAFDTSLAAEPGNVEVLRVAAQTADQSGQRVAFRKFLDQGLAIAPKDPYFVDASLRYESAFGDPVKTIAPRVAFRDANPQQPGPWLALVGSYANSARVAKQSGDEKAAADYAAKALATATQAADKFPGVPQIVIEAARQKAAAGDRAGADALAGKLAADPATAADVNVQTSLGDYFLGQNQGDAALAAYERAAATNKASDEVRVRVAQLRANENDVDGALKSLDAIAKPGPAVRELRVNLLLAAKRADEAAKYVDAQLVADRSVSNLLLGAIVKARAGDLAGARSLADEAVGKDPEDAAARFARVQIALARPADAKNDDVIADLQVVKKNNPTNLDARQLLADRLDAAGRPADAREERESILRDAPGNRTATLRLIEAYSQDRPVPYARIDSMLAEAKRVAGADDAGLLTTEANVAIARGDNARAIAAIRAATAASAPDDVNARRRMYATMLRADGASQLLAELDKRQATDATFYWHHLARGIALHRLKRDADAAGSFERALALAQSLVDDAPVDEIAGTYAAEYGTPAAVAWAKAKMPAGPRQQATLVNLYAQAHDYETAVAAGAGLVDQADALSPTVRTVALTSYGSAALATTPPHAAEARAAFEKLATLDPTNYMTLNNIACAMALDADHATPQQTLEVAKRAYVAMVARGAADASRAYVGDTYGWALVLAGQPDQALTVLRQARQVQALPEVDYHIGEALIAQKQGADALDALQNALANIKKLKQNQTAVDPSLEGRIADAIRRAQALS